MRPLRGMFLRHRAARFFYSFLVYSTESYVLSPEEGGERAERQPSRGSHTKVRSVSETRGHSYVSFFETRERQPAFYEIYKDLSF